MPRKNKKNIIATENYLDKRLDEQAQVILKALDLVVTKHVSEAKEELKTEINKNQIIIDGYVKNQEDFKQEFFIIKEEIKQIKNVLKEKLGFEIKAIA